MGLLAGSCQGSRGKTPACHTEFDLFGLKGEAGLGYSPLGAGHGHPLLFEKFRKDTVDCRQAVMSPDESTRPAQLYLTLL